MKISPFLALLSAFFLSLTLSALADDSPTTWTEFPKPGANKGLFLCPRLLADGSRVHMVWSGTNEQIRTPELMVTYMGDGDDNWKDPRAPFFGKNKARVRKVAIGQSRNLIGILFQRSLRQSNDAYEVLLTISGDQGWDWSNTVEIDSYVAEKTGGTALSVEGRRGRNRPEFAMAWVREFGNVRAANFDFNSTVRPEGTLIGQVTGSAEKVEVGTLGSKGFSVVFNHGAGLATAHVKGLIGTISEGDTFLRGRFGNAFSVASRPTGPSRLAVATGNQIEAFTSNELSWKNDKQTGTLPFQSSGVTVEADQDEDRNLHVAILRPNNKKFEVWYIAQKKGKWGEAELVHSFDDKVDMRGFDICATGRYAFIVASQGFEGKVFRKKFR